MKFDYVSPLNQALTMQVPFMRTLSAMTGAEGMRSTTPRQPKTTSCCTPHRNKRFRKGRPKTARAPAGRLRATHTHWAVCL